MQAPLQARNDSVAAQMGTSRTVAQNRFLVDNRPETVAQRKLAELMNNCPRVLQQRSLSDAIHNSPRMVTQRHEMKALFGGALKPQGDGAIPAEASPTQCEEKTNNTGLPKDVPTLQMKSGVAVNDEAGLEGAEDLMGGRFFGAGQLDIHEKREATRLSRTVAVTRESQVKNTTNSMLDSNHESPVPLLTKFGNQTRAPLQRSEIETEGGNFKTTEYIAMRDRADQTVGANVTIEFNPDDGSKYDAIKIGMIQTNRRTVKGELNYNDNSEKMRASSEGWAIDMKSHAGEHRVPNTHPVYQSEFNSNARTAAKIEEVGETSDRGKIWVKTEPDNAATLVDRPRFHMGMDVTDEFEVAAVVIDGTWKEGVGRLLGSVHWGWMMNKNAAMPEMIPFKLGNVGTATPEFFGAAKAWNEQKLYNDRDEEVEGKAVQIPIPE